MTPWWNGSRCEARRRALVSRTIAALVAAGLSATNSLAEIDSMAATEDDPCAQTDAADGAEFQSAAEVR